VTTLDEARSNRRNRLQIQRGLEGSAQRWFLALAIPSTAHEEVVDVRGYQLPSLVPTSKWSNAAPRTRELVAQSVSETMELSPTRPTTRLTGVVPTFSLRRDPWWRAAISRLARERARIRRFTRFAVVGASGIVVNEVAMAIMVSGFGIDYVVGAVLATQCSTLWNCALVDFWAFKGSSHRNRRWQRWLMLIMLNNAANLATIPLLIFLTSVLGINYLISNLVTILLVVGVRFALADRIWAPARAGAAVYA